MSPDNPDKPDVVTRPQVEDCLRAIPGRHLSGRPYQENRLLRAGGPWGFHGRRAARALRGSRSGPRARAAPARAEADRRPGQTAAAVASGSGCRLPGEVINDGQDPLPSP